ncbi:MAG TPA: trigger factor [Gaiellales bacterium]|jgi:trigger factor
MKTQVSELADNRVRLDVEVPAGDVDHAFDHALSDLAQSIRVPGFRKGKAPKPLVMRQVGRDTVVEEALRDHLTGWYSRAVAEAGIDPVDRPTIDWSDEPAEGAPFAFTAEVAVKPPPEVKSYKGLDGVKPEVEVPEDAVEGEIERLRLTVAELTAVERGAKDGDFLVIDFEGSMDGKPFEGGAGSQYAVELGTGRLVEELEAGLVGMKVGEERDIDLTMPADYAAEHLAGKPVRFHVKIGDVKERVLPELDDEFATSVSEFDTLEELRADVRERVRTVVAAEADRRFRSSVLDSLGAELQTPVPDALVQNRLQSMTRSLSQTLQSRGIALADYLRVTGMTSEELVADMRVQAQDLVRKDLALEAVVAAEAVEVTDEMVEAWVREQAAESGEDVETSVQQLMADPATLTALRQDLAAQKALDIVTENAKPITAEQAEAKQKLWTPEKETAQSAAKSSPIWTPGT